MQVKAMTLAVKNLPPALKDVSLFMVKDELTAKKLRILLSNSRM